MALGAIKGDAGSAGLQPQGSSDHRRGLGRHAIEGIADKRRWMALLQRFGTNVLMLLEAEGFGQSLFMTLMTTRRWFSADRDTDRPGTPTALVGRGEGADCRRDAGARCARVRGARRWQVCPQQVFDGAALRARPPGDAVRSLIERVVLTPLSTGKGSRSSWSGRSPQ